VKRSVLISLGDINTQGEYKREKIKVLAPEPSERSEEEAANK
jgi:hypothetical protein